MNADATAQLKQLFKQCDLDGSGYIDEEELAAICTELSPEELADVFKELDQDGDGKISIAEFSAGLKGIGGALLGRQRKRSERLSTRSDSKESQDSDGGEASSAREAQDFVVSLDEGFTALSCQEQVCDLYQHLHSSEQPHLLAQFENVVLSVIKDLRQQQFENDRLERSYKREKDTHTRHLRQLEEEMEAQMQRVETRVRSEERSRSDSEREELKAHHEAELSELQANLKRLQKLDLQLQKSAADEDYKVRVDELTFENRQMKSQVTDANTNLAVLRSEIVTLRQEYEAKCDELESEKSTLIEYINEQDNLTRQVHMLQQANKKLHDTNDDLREAIDTSRSSQKRSHNFNCKPAILLFQNTQQNRPGLTKSKTTSGTPHRRGSFMSDYFSGPVALKHKRRHSSSSLAEEMDLSRISPEQAAHQLQAFNAQDSCDIESLPEDMDSGHSTLRDVPDIESEYEPNSIEDDATYYYPNKRNRLAHREMDSTTESEFPESQDEMETEIAGLPDDDEEDDVDGLCPDGLPSRPTSACSRASSQGSAKRRAGSTRRMLPALPQTQIMRPITSEPERMYKVVLAGDAAVGKSSFIMRLCKGKFVNNISSTLGVDFQTKILEVDGRVIALQLWDTAGQERFRSIAKSYFRRADGVLLLYDCTYERSFLNVREWVDAIEDSVQKKIPVMFVANKIDMRDDLEAEGKKVVKFEDGQRLAKDYEGLFIESSAKSGENILESVTELTRLLRTNEDLEVKNVGMSLHELQNTPKKKSGCCN